MDAHEGTNCMQLTSESVKPVPQEKPEPFLPQIMMKSHGLVYIPEGRVKHHSRKIKETEERLLSIRTDLARQLANSAEKRPRY